MDHLCVPGVVRGDEADVESGSGRATGDVGVRVAKGRAKEKGEAMSKKPHYHLKRALCECGRPLATRYKGEPCCLRCYQLDSNPVRNETCGYRPIYEQVLNREEAQTVVAKSYRKWAKKKNVEVVSYNGVVLKGDEL